MKVLGKKPELCIACHACESICSKTWTKEDNPAKSCIQIKEAAEGTQIITCTQCGECMTVCQVEALKRDKNGIIRLDKKSCVGCFMCVGFCPELAMIMHEDYIEPLKCVSCGQCVKVCPTQALYMEEK